MKAAAEGPPFITNRGLPTHVLLCIEHYEALAAPLPSIIELLASPCAEPVAFEAPRLHSLLKTPRLGSAEASPQSSALTIT